MHRRIRRAPQAAVIPRTRTIASWPEAFCILTYPLSKLIGSAWGGYLWIGYFNGYGEDILDYNQRNHWIARIGYSIAR
jgi:outer membrane phospholipase A